MNSPLILVVEKLVADPAERFFTGTLRSLGMGVQKVGKQFRKQPGPVGNAFAEHLDTEVTGLEDESVPSACAIGQDVRTEPVWAVHRVDFVGLLRRQLLSLELFIEPITELDVG